jgi:creatinine amidohydrolase
VLPIGATEDHGPHLPPTTDTLIAEALAARVAARTGGRCLPAIPYGYCRTTSGLAATVSIGFDTVRALARDVASSLAGSGSRNVCVITGHGGSAHLAALQEGVREALSGREGVRAVVVSPWQLGVGDIVKEPPYHAGEAETSLVLAIAPELVHMELARAGPPPPPPAFVLPAPAPAAAVWGDPRLGTAEKGAAILSRWTDAVAGLLEAEPRSAE